MMAQKVAWPFLSRFVVYGIQTFFLCMLHSVFSALFVDFFLRSKLFTQVNKENTSEQYISELKSTTLWNLVIGQTGYVVWSTLDDVGFSGFSKIQLKFTRRLRFSRLSVCGPLWALTFGLLWLPMRMPYVSPGLNFMALMIMYDKLFMYCLTTSQAMLYGNRRRTAEREKFNTMIIVFRVIGSAGVGLASCLYDGTNSIKWVGTFRAYNGVWALMAGFTFYMFGRSQNEIDVSSGVDDVKNCSDVTPQSSNKFFTFAFRTLKRNSMSAAGVIYALQTYSSALSTNFFGLLLMVVCARKPSSPLSSLLQALSFAVPHALSALITRLCELYGNKNTVSMILLLRWILGFLLLLLSVKMAHDARGDGGISTGDPNLGKQGAAPPTPIHRYGIAFATLFFAHRVLTEITTHLQPAVLADVTDEDTVVFGRNEPMSAAIQRLVTIPSKLFHSLAVIYVCICLDKLDAIPLDVPHMAGSARDLNVAARVVSFVGLNILFVTTFMLIVWTKWYDLSGKYLVFIQMAMRKRVEMEMIGDV